MERRGFLKGLFGGVTATGIIVAASPAEIDAFTAPLVRHQPILLDAPTPTATHVGEHLYNARGELVAVVTDLSLSPDAVPGRAHVDIRAMGVRHLLPGT